MNRKKQLLYISLATLLFVCTSVHADAVSFNERSWQEKSGIVACSAVASIPYFASKMIYTIRRMDIEEATLLNIKAQEYFYQGLDDTAKMTRAILSHPKMLSRFGTEGLIERANIVAKYYMNIIIKKVMELEATSKAILESVEKSRFYVMMALRYATHMYMNTPGGIGIHFSPNLIDNEKETEGRYFPTVDNTTTVSYTHLTLPTN